MALPSGSTLQGNFLPLEIATPSDKTNSSISFLMNGNFSNAVLNTTGGYFNTNISIQSQFATQIAKAFNKKVVYGDNSEQMLFTIKEFNTDSSNPAYQTNVSSIFPSSIGGIFQRGYNGTTKSPLYGYDTTDGYFENVYTLDALALNSTFPSDVINKKAVFHVETNTTDTTIKLWLYDPNCYSGANGVFHPIPDSRGLTDKWYMGLNKLTSSDWDYTTHWVSSAYSKLSAELVGRTLKISKIDNNINDYEEILINDILSIKNDNKSGSSIGAINTAGEYFPVYVEVSVSRAQNGTTAIDTTTNQLTVNYTVSGTTTTKYNSYYNAWIDANERERSPIAKATFQLEVSPGNSSDTKWFNWSLSNFSSGNCVFNPQDFNNYVSGPYVTTASYSNFKEIWKRVNREMRGSTYFSTNNAEQMILRHLTDIEFYSSDTGNSGNNGQWPYQMSAYWTRGANGTTATKQYGYGSGYYANVYNTTKETETVINSSLSGAILENSTSNTTIDLFFVTNGALYPGFIMEYDHLALRFNLDDPLTSTEMTGIKNGSYPNTTSALLKLNTQFAGQIIKVYSPQYDTTEDILINSVTNITVSNDTQIAPNDSGKYIPDKITLSVSRAQNGTTANSYSSNQVNITNSGGSNGIYSIVNAFIEDSSQIITESYEEDLTLEEELETQSGLIELLSETLLLQDSQQIISTNIIQGFFQEYLLLETNLEMFTYKNVLVLFNDLLVLHENYNTNIDVKVLYNDIIMFLDDYNAVNLNDFLLFLNEVIKFNDSDLVIFNVGKIIELLLSEYFIINESSEMSKEVFSKHQEFLEFNNELNTERSSLLSFSENLNFVNLLETNKITQQNFEEILLASCMLMLDGEMYECYSLFMENGSITRYDNYNFNSYCKFNGEYYATSKDMLVKLFNNESTTETDFKASFKTGVVNASNDEDLTSQNNNLRNKQKFLSFSTFTLTSKGQILFNIINDKKEKFTYNLVYKNVDGKIEQSFGTKVRGNYFELELTTNDDLELQDYIIYPTILNKYNK